VPAQAAPAPVPSSKTKWTDDQCEWLAKRYYEWPKYKNQQKSIRYWEKCAREFKKQFGIERALDALRKQTSLMRLSRQGVNDPIQRKASSKQQSPKELDWLAKHEEKWRAQASASGVKRGNGNGASRNWPESARDFAEHCGRQLSISSIRRLVAEWNRNNTANQDDKLIFTWTTQEEEWLAERVPARECYSESYLRKVANDFKLKFDYTRTPASFRSKLERLLRPP
jgi:hypothetical protein